MARSKTNRNTSVSLQTIAKKAGVSVMTVSRALSHREKGKSAAASRRADRIRRIARELGYRRSPAPQAIVTGRFNAIGILSSSTLHRGNLPSRRLSMLERRLDQIGLHLMLGQATDEQLTDPDQVASILQDWMIDGLIMDYVQEIPEGLEDMLERYGVPAIWVNSKHDANCIYVDDRHIARVATEALIQAGHRKICYCGPEPEPKAHYSVTDRYEAYLETMKAAGLEPILWTCPVFEMSDAMRGIVESRLHEPDVPTAVVAYRQAMGQCVVGACLRQGLRIPHDLELVVVDEYGGIGLGYLGIPRIEIPEEEIGLLAAEMIVRRIEDPNRFEAPQVLKPGLILSDESLAPPSR